MDDTARGQMDHVTTELSCDEGPDRQDGLLTAGVATVTEAFLPS